MKLLLIYIATLVLFLLIDMVWLGLVAKTTYAVELGSLIRPQVDFKAAVLFYLLFAAGLVYFSVMPALAAGSTMQALMTGAALGLVAYGTYDLTNLAVINGFGWKIGLIDLAWGTVLSGVTSAVVVSLMQRFG